MARPPRRPDHPAQGEGRVTAATVCDHVDPKSKLSEATFFKGPFQSLCDSDPWRCHSRKKQQQEKGRYHADVGADGMPTDPDHPFNR
jgi:5-methylcytosine-specific restriction enzyme A